MNQQFDLVRWMQRCPLQPELGDRSGRYRGMTVTGPTDLCNNEQLRKKIHHEIEWGRPVPTDIFVMSDGDDLSNRDATKIGGLPYRSVSSPWPTARDGVPLLFLAQFNFTDSSDIVSDVPGDVLLVFYDPRSYWDDLTFEWVTLGVSDLVCPLRAAAYISPFRPCVGHRCRVNSFPEASRTCREGIVVDGYPVDCGYLLGAYQGTQIGKAPYTFGALSDPTRAPDDVICSIGSVVPNWHLHWPLINVASPRVETWRDPFNPENYLVIDDVGSIFILLHDDLTMSSFSLSL